MAIVGSGPAGLAAADQLNRAGHSVTVFEKSDRIGGLLRYGIPEFKMEKRFLDRRLAVMEAEGVVFQAGVNVGVDLPADRLRGDFDAVLLAGRRRASRAICRCRAASSQGVHFAMEYLTLQNRRNEGDAIADADFISAEGKHVIIIGGGDTGADCLGTAHRQGARSVHQLELLPMPPQDARRQQPVAGVAADLPRVVGARGGRRAALLGVHAALLRRRDGRVKALHAVKVELAQKDGRTEFEPVRRQRVRDPGRSGAAGDGLHRPGEGRGCSTTSAWT